MIDGKVSKCKFSGCKNRYHGHGYCTTHLTRLKKHGGVDIVLKRGAKKVLPVKCTIYMCRRVTHAKDRCSMHYIQLLRKKKKGLTSS